MRETQLTGFIRVKGRRKRERVRRKRVRARRKRE